jgi:hypothetical protein
MNDDNHPAAEADTVLDADAEAVADAIIDQVVAVTYVNLAGLPGWGSDAGPNDLDTSTILDRYLGPAAGAVRLVHGCTALAMFPDVRGAVNAALDLLAEAARTSGSANAGMHVTVDPSDDIGPASHAGRLAAQLADLAEADRLLVTGEVIAALSPADGSALSFDPAPSAELDGERIATYAVRRR